MPRGRKKKVFVSVATQTTEIIPLVKLTRLTSKDIEKYTSRCIPIKEAMKISKLKALNEKELVHNGINNPNSIITRIPMNPSEIQPIPNTYMTFIRPINNNENANSTFDASTDNVKALHKKQAIEEVKTNAKEGMPKTLDENHINEGSKQKEADVNNFVNVMNRKTKVHKIDVLSDISAMIMRNCTANPPLIPEFSLSPPSEFNDTLSLNEQEYNICDQGTQTEQDEINLLDRNIIIDSDDKISDDNVSNDLDVDDNVVINEIVIDEELNRRKSVRFKTLNISTLSDNSSAASDGSKNNQNKSKKSDKSEKSQKSEKYKKCIRITATTVHIHNHFYKQ